MIRRQNKTRIKKIGYEEDTKNTSKKKVISTKDLFRFSYFGNFDFEKIRHFREQVKGKGR